mmetsp:Transcript_29399/g.62439  ORF Transcript_29399/g.62439 Transcript_29399/m.62439 type:complete len:471 (+) Transcript_29399:191-1603(+)
MFKLPTMRGGSDYTSSSSSSSLDQLVVYGGTTSLATLLFVQLLTPADPIGKSLRFLKQLRAQEGSSSSTTSSSSRGCPADGTAASSTATKLTSGPTVASSVQSYETLQAAATSVQTRNAQYSQLVNAYYDLATLFYEWGWGSSFHFSNRWPGEGFDEATRRHEFYLAGMLDSAGALGRLRRGRGEGKELAMADVRILDVGCGIGGPMRNICKFTGCDVTGLTLNQYQVDRGNELCRSDPHFVVHGSDEEEPKLLCRSVQGDFMSQPFAPSTFDAAYAIEATCHAPDRLKCYSEIYRVLKPGAVFACYEWCLTDRYDPANPEHVRIKKQIEEGDGLPDIATMPHCLDALKGAGFEILHERDCVLDEYGGWQDPATKEYSTSREARKHFRGGKPWMLPLMPSWNPFTQRFQFNWLGLGLTKYGLKVMEFVGLAPKGTSRTQILLQSGGMGLARGGELGIFTPMYLMVGRKPE